MITVNNKEYRNLVEQVGYLTNRVDEHYERDRVLADYGIRIVGSVDSVDNLPPANTYDGLYGDAYTVGTGAPYDFYIFTRPLQGETENRWLDLGQLAIQGPQGDIGPEGPVGPQGESTQWYVGQGQPYIEANVNSLYFDTTTSNIYQKQEGQWIMVANIKGNTGAQGPQGPQGEIGPQGPQGIQGENGVPGDAVNIVGILTSSSMLPDPDTVARDSAYVVEDGTGQWLYFITGLGTAESPLIWDKVAFENGTTVLVGGNPVQTFDADSKVDKFTVTTGPDKLYAYTPATQTNRSYTIASNKNFMEGGYMPIYVNTDNTAGTDGPWNINKGFLITQTPQQNYHSANKKYVDEQVQAVKDASVEKNTTQEYIVYGTSSVGTQTTHTIATTNARRTAGSIPSYSSLTNTNADTIPSNATLIVSTPTKIAQAANKQYVDNNLSIINNRFLKSKILLGYTSYYVSNLIETGVPCIIELTPCFNKQDQVGQFGLGFSSGTMIYTKLQIIYTGSGIPYGVGYKSDGTRVVFSSGLTAVYISGVSMVSVEYSPAIVDIAS